MHDFARDKLCELISRHGQELVTDAARCEALLRDYCASYKRELSVLSAAQRDRIPEELAKSSRTGAPWLTTLAQLSKRLCDNYGISPVAAKWAVEAWALALGVISPTELSPPSEHEQPAVPSEPASNPVQEQMVAEVRTSKRGFYAIVGICLLVAAGFFFFATPPRKQLTRNLYAAEAPVTHEVPSNNRPAINALALAAPAAFQKASDLDISSSATAQYKSDAWSVYLDTYRDTGYKTDFAIQRVAHWKEEHNRQAREEQNRVNKEALVAAARLAYEKAERLDGDHSRSPDEKILEWNSYLQTHTEAAYMIKEAGTRLTYWKEHVTRKAAEEQAKREKQIADEQRRKAEEAARQKAEQEAEERRQKAEQEAEERRQEEEQRAKEEEERRIEESKPKAEVKKVWADHNVIRNGKKGMLIHVEFDAENCQEEELDVIAYFEEEDGSALSDSNGNYRTNDGHVSASKRVRSPFQSSHFADTQIFIPNDELHMSAGKHELQYSVQVHKDGESIGSSDPSKFTYTKNADIPDPVPEEDDMNPVSVYEKRNWDDGSNPLPVRFGGEDPVPVKFLPEDSLEESDGAVPVYVVYPGDDNYDNAISVLLVKYPYHKSD